LDRICLKALAKKIEERFASMHEFAKVLGDYLDSIDAQPSTGTRTDADAATAKGSPRPAAAKAVLLVVLVAIVGWASWLLWNSRQPDSVVQEGRIGQSQSAVQADLDTKPASVENACIWIRRDGDDKKVQQVVWEKGAEDPSAVFAPIHPSDDFKFRAEFDRPTYWHLAWFDTRGVAEIVAYAEEREQAMEFPQGENMAYVNPNDPDGHHLLMLLVADRSPEDLDQALEQRFADLGPPPNPSQDQTIRFRGFGGTRQTGVKFEADYAREVENRLPEGVRWVHQLWLPARH
jgi:hypothetical protein